ncbi:hypothetical protein [Bacillus sp. S14(2024)]|uniref:hypothetical protein n=1 Tax=Bacillus sp. S14(2024) TaxID=3162884 RepID=UPI003D248218
MESVFKLAFNQPITLKDAAKISVKGPDGFLEIHNEVVDGVLTIKPELFKGDTTYTLTIKKEAVSGYLGMQLPNDIEMEFQTEGVPTGWQQINEKWYYYSPITGKEVTG